MKRPATPTPIGGCRHLRGGGGLDVEESDAFMEAVRARSKTKGSFGRNAGSMSASPPAPPHPDPKIVEARARDAADVAVTLFKLVSDSDVVYREARKRGYDVMGFDIPYDTKPHSARNETVRWRTVVLLTLNGIPVQRPPVNHPELAGSHLSGRDWPPVDEATLSAMKQATIELSAVAEQRKVKASQRDQLG